MSFAGTSVKLKQVGLGFADAVNGSSGSNS